jgi:hypothetical protein
MTAVQVQDTSAAETLRTGALPAAEPTYGPATNVHMINLNQELELPCPDLSASAAKLGWSFTCKVYDSGIRTQGTPEGNLLWPNYEEKIGDHQVAFRDLVSLGTVSPFIGGTITYVSDDNHMLNIKFTLGAPELTLDGIDMLRGTSLEVKAALAKKLLELAREFVHKAPFKTSEDEKARADLPLLKVIRSF